MITCKRFRVEVYRCPSGSFHVTVQPVKYLGQEEFKAWFKLCMRNFMTISSRKPWAFIYHNVRALRAYLNNHEKIIVYYLGDLDPSGVDIQRFLEEALENFGVDFEKVELKRLAVTPEQVETYNLPPRPEDAETLAKLRRDPRYKAYSLDYIVELDVLLAYAPAEFRRLVHEAIESQWDEAIYRELLENAEEQEQEAQKLLDEIKDRARKKILEQNQRRLKPNNAKKG